MSKFKEVTITVPQLSAFNAEYEVTRWVCTSPVVLCWLEHSFGTFAFRYVCAIHTYRGKRKYVLHSLDIVPRKPNEVFDFTKLFDRVMAQLDTRELDTVFLCSPHGPYRPNVLCAKRHLRKTGVTTANQSFVTLQAPDVSNTLNIVLPSIYQESVPSVLFQLEQEDLA